MLSHCSSSRAYSHTSLQGGPSRYTTIQCTAMRAGNETNESVSTNPLEEDCTVHTVLYFFEHSWRRPCHLPQHNPTTLCMDMTTRRVVYSTMRVPPMLSPSSNAMGTTRFPSLFSGALPVGNLFSFIFENNRKNILSSHLFPDAQTLTHSLFLPVCH